MTQSPYHTNDVALLARLASAADVRLQAQLASAIAADQRALVFGGFLAAAAAALGGAASSVLTGNEVDHFFGLVALAAAGGSLVAMACAVIAARPVYWFFPGSTPSAWQSDIASQKTEAASLEELLADYDDRITNNFRTMQTNGRWLMAAAIIVFFDLAVCGIIIGCHIR